MRIKIGQRGLKKIALNIISPNVIFLLIWLGQLLAHVFGVTGLNSPSWITWLVVLSGVLCFLLGSSLATLVVKSFSFNKTAKLRQIKANKANLQRLDYFATFSIAISCASVFFLLKNFQIFDLSFLANLKDNMLEESSTGNKSNIYLIYPLVFNALVSIYYICVNGRTKKAKSFAIFLVTSILCLFSGSRALLIFFWLALIPQIIYLKTVYRPSVIFTAIGAIVALLASIFLYPVIFHGAELDLTSNSYLLNYASVYMFSGVAAFNSFLENGHPSFDCILTVPSIFSQFLSLFFISSINNCPKFYPEVFVPLPTNIYTLFFPVVHDYGILGLLVYLSTIGFAASFLYINGFFRDSLECRFIYGIVFFSLVMSAFDDQFLRGYLYYFPAAFLLVVFRVINSRNFKFL